MSRKFNIDDYSKEKLKRARMCETVEKKSFLTGNKSTFILCPHCHKQIDFFSYVKELPDYSYKSTIRKKTGAELRCCRRCGEIYLDPRYREEALGGRYIMSKHEYVSTVICGIFCTIPVLISLALYAKNFTFAEINKDIIFICFFAAIILVVTAEAVVAMVLRSGKYRQSKGSDYEKSRKRLQNIYYLKAMDRLGRPLPEMYTEIINKGEFAEEGTPKQTDKFPVESSARIFRLIKGCCSYCGLIVKEPESYSRFNRPITKCPKCRSFIYDSNLMELTAYPESRRKNIYNSTLEEIKCFRNRVLKIIVITGLISLVLTIVIVWLHSFLYTCPPNPDNSYMTENVLCNSKSTRDIITVIILLIIIDCLCGYFLLFNLADLFRVFKSHNKSFDEVVRESENRMKDQNYAEIVRKAINENNTELEN